VLTTLLNFRASNIYSVSILEVASAVDSVAARAVFKPAISETTSASDTVTAMASFKPAISEAASAVDTVSTRAMFKPAITEAASATDTPSTRAIFRPAISEAASAADNVSVSAKLKVALIEVAAAADRVTGIKQFVVSTIDVAAALDALGAAEYAMWQPSQVVALETDYGSSTIDRFVQTAPPVTVDHTQAISFFVSLGYQIAPGQVFTATLTRPDGTTFSVNSLRVQPQFNDVYTALGRFHGGTYVFCFLNAGVISQIGQWSINIVSGTNVSAPAYFTAT